MLAVTLRSRLARGLLLPDVTHVGEQVEQAADFEQFTYMADQTAKREPDGVAISLVGRDQQCPECGAGQIANRSQIDDNRFLSRRNQFRSRVIASSALVLSTRPSRATT